MPTLTGSLHPRHGAVVFVKVMQSPEYVDALKKAGLPFATPVLIPGILDTGASCSVLDGDVIRRMALRHRGVAEVHSATTEEDRVVHRDVHDAMLVIGELESPPLAETVSTIESRFTNRGDLALIGRDILCRCVLTYDGPANTYALSW